MKISTRQLTIAGVLGALMIVIGVVGIWAIPVPNLSGAMTIMHIPIIIGAILCGPTVGFLLSIIFAVFVQISFGSAFPWYVLIPGRLFIGPLAWLAYAGVRRAFQRQGEIRPAVAAIMSLLVAGGIFAIGYFSLLPNQNLNSWATVHQTALKGESEAILAKYNTKKAGEITSQEDKIKYEELKQEAGMYEATVGNFRDVRFIGIAFSIFAAIGFGSLTWFGLLKTKAEAASISLSAVTGTLTNSVLTLGLGVVFPTILGETIANRFKVALGVLATNSLLEVVLAVLVCLAIVPTLLKVLNKEM